MIEVGALTVIDFKTYTVLKIDEEGMAHLKDVTTAQGRPMKMRATLVPYFENGEFITPEPEPLEKHKIKTKLSIRKIAKEEIEMPLSNSAVRLIAEWADTAIRNIAINAQKNAIARGSNSITAAHIFWMETNMQVEGYWPTHLDYVKKED
jgi:histone H3/H4